MKICSVKNCERPFLAKGFCHRHYKQMYKYGKLLPEKTKYEKCQAPNCERDHYAKSYCGKHYKQLQTRGKILERTHYDKNEIIEKKNYALIVLYNRSGNRVAVTKIDKEDIPKCENIRWYSKSSGHVAGGKYNLQLAHHIMGHEPSRLKVIDHINRDPRDNRKANLRMATHTQNTRNANLPTNNTSGYKGVSFRKERSKYRNKWSAQIRVDSKLINLGFFKDKRDAAKAYDKAARKYFGEFAYQNEVNDD